ncbi:hypothetical protein GGR58DRAFT_268607 [Xylaria digitata]|nr:hypothetical protein GGR58DRAFT_268607 [Xylaria digitata]
MQEHHRAILTLTQHGSYFSGNFAKNDGIINQGNITNVYNSQGFAGSAGVEEVLKQLDVVPYADIKNAIPEGADEICTWFTTQSLFECWLRGPPSILWAFAYPGCGKSKLARYIVDKLPTTETRTTCYFFFEHGTKGCKSLSSALCCILRQLFKQRPELLSPEISAEFKEHNTTTGSFQQLWDIFVSAASQSDSGDIVCIIDGLDECKNEDKKKLLAALKRLYYSGSGSKPLNIRLFLTSCPLGYTQRHFQPVGKEVPHIDLRLDNLVIINQAIRKAHLVTEGVSESLRREFSLGRDASKEVCYGLRKVVYAGLGFGDNV